MRGVGWKYLAAMLIAAQASAADLDPRAKEKYQATIDKGRDRLLTLQKPMGTGLAAICGYALIKAGLSKDHPHVREIAEAAAARINKGSYGVSGQEPPHHIYEGCCDAMLLAEVDPVGYKPQLEILRDYFVRKQLTNGAWFYPTAPPEAGDTSITQFALLGLWAAKRSNVDVPQSTWERAARWLIATQRKDGGFEYHPHDPNALAAPNEPLGRQHSMTPAGCGSLLIIRRMLYGAAGDPEEPAPQPASRKRFGVLERLPDEKPVAAAKRDRPPGVSLESLNKAIRSAQAWIADHYHPLPTPRFVPYMHYTCERVGALLGSETFGSHRWYDEGAEALLKLQRPTGEWTDTWIGGGNELYSTAFALLFFSRATMTIVTPPAPKARTHGGGLLGGGRGLPDDLSQVNIRDGQVKKRVSQAPIDKLLAELEKPAGEVTETQQNAVVEAVQLDNRDALVGQVERLRKLIGDARPEVRQVACWALGRSDDLRQAPLLIAALLDPDLDVAAEASLALCVLSRQPEGVRSPIGQRDLLPNEPPEPRDGEDAASYFPRAKAWQEASQRAWRAWYLQVRPYDERDDRQQLRGK